MLKSSLWLFFFFGGWREDDLWGGGRAIDEMNFSWQSRITVVIRFPAGWPARRRDGGRKLPEALSTSAFNFFLLIWGGSKILGKIAHTVQVTSYNNRGITPP